MAKKNDSTEANAADAALEAVESGPLADIMSDVFGDAGAGLGNITTAELAIPTLRILQRNSHEVDENDDKYVDGAKQGMFFILTPTGPVAFDGDRGVDFHVCHFEKAWIEWKPQETGGGFVRRHPTEAAAIELSDRANEVDETWEYYGYVLPPDGGAPIPVLFGCSSSKLSVARRLNSALTGVLVPKPDGKGTFTPPSWYTAVRLTTKSVTNSAGQRYFNFDFRLNGPIGSRELYEMCRNFNQAVKTGGVKTYGDAQPSADDTPSF